MFVSDRIPDVSTCLQPAIAPDPCRRYAAGPVLADKELFVASCSVTTTRRRRFMWVAWWTAPPAREPFRKPDAFSGGARSHEEALAQARRAAGVLLVEIEPYWARAWARVLLGRPPWGVRAEGASSSSAHSRSNGRSTAAMT